MKKDNSSFKVTMGSFDGAEICKIVRLYLLDKLSNLLGNESVGLSRDDGFAAINSCSVPVLHRTRKNIVALFKKEGLGLAAINSCSGPVLDRTRKNIIALSKKEGLNITIQTNLVETDFLDVTFKLVIEKYFPYRKPNNDPLSINAKSNHPPTIIKDIPKMINKHLSDLSCNEDEFKRAKPL